MSESNTTTGLIEAFVAAATRLHYAMIHGLQSNDLNFFNELKAKGIFLDSIFTSKSYYSVHRPLKFDIKSERADRTLAFSLTIDEREP